MVTNSGRLGVWARLKRTQASWTQQSIDRASCLGVRLNVSGTAGHQQTLGRGDDGQGHSGQDQGATWSGARQSGPAPRSLRRATCSSPGRGGVGAGAPGPKLPKAIRNLPVGLPHAETMGSANCCAVGSGGNPDPRATHRLLARKAVFYRLIHAAEPVWAALAGALAPQRGSSHPLLLLLLLVLRRAPHAFSTGRGLTDQTHSEI
jgi:hypothetical protein